MNVHIEVFFVFMAANCRGVREKKKGRLQASGFCLDTIFTDFYKGLRSKKKTSPMTSYDLLLFQRND